MFDLPAPLPLPVNEPILSYAPDSPERRELEQALVALSGITHELPHVVGGRTFMSKETFDVRAPHAHRLHLGVGSHGREAVTAQAIAAAMATANEWAHTPFESRARIFTRAADLIAGPWRQRLNAATMLGQSKTAHQAEIDSACELIDFLRFNVAFASRLAEQPLSSPGVRNVLELRPLEGFVLAITPFNFTAIAGNLPGAPALLGNVVVWKPSESQALAAQLTMQVFEAAGLPRGVINLVHGDGASVAATALAHPSLAGVHFTGSTEIFRSLWQTIGANIRNYRSYPRLVGETGGKDFVLAHPSADVRSLIVALVRGAYEYQGQKCSAASRAYVPRSLWAKAKEELLAEIGALTIGNVADFRNFMGAVIHERSFNKLKNRIDAAQTDARCNVLTGSTNRQEGWFVHPTLIEVSDPGHPLMSEELFGPVLSLFVYDDARFEEVLTSVDTASEYALTGAIFAEDRRALAHAAARLRQSAGNLYINDKPTGAVVGQQPFGGGRASGTNDKAGSSHNLLRWVSPRTIKEVFVPPRVVGYPSMA
jgi:1-pyrroline-5-carboxylate dehydrogenase